MITRAFKTAILLSAFAVYAQTHVVRAFEMWFDEKGNAVASINGGPLFPVDHGVEVEPASQISTLYYLLPETVQPGDVLVWENQGHTTLSDILRFTTTKLYYFSDKSGPEDTALADNGFPVEFDPNASEIEEVGTEGNTHFDWFPTGNSFHGVSDGTLSVPDAGPGFVLSAVAILFPLYIRRLAGKRS